MQKRTYMFQSVHCIPPLFKKSRKRARKWASPFFISWQRVGNFSLVCKGAVATVPCFRGNTGMKCVTCHEFAHDFKLIRRCSAAKTPRRILERCLPSSALCATGEAVVSVHHDRATVDIIPRAAFFRLQIVSRFAVSAGSQPEQPALSHREVRSASAARLSDAQALRAIPGSNWSAHTARRQLTKTTAAVNDAARLLYAEVPPQQLRRVYTTECGEAQHINNQHRGTEDKPSAKRRKTTYGGDKSQSASSAFAATAATLAPTLVSLSCLPLRLHSLVWAQYREFPYWPGRVVAVTDTSLSVHFFGDGSTESFKLPHRASVLPFHHERSQEFVQAGRAQHDIGLRTKFLDGHQDALQAKPLELQTPRSDHNTAHEVCRRYSVRSFALHSFLYVHSAC